MLKNLIKKFIPQSWLNRYHLTMARLANYLYNYPSEKLIVIGVTGTNGKSTTVNLIARILEEAGPPAGGKTALSSTVNFMIGNEEWLNNLKMTMPGRFFLQKLLARAVKAGCKFAIIESTSEGILQHRHLGIHYDAMVFTNLTPEHLDAHGGFENYRKAKLEYFQYLQSWPNKIIGNKRIRKTIIANADDPASREFTDFQVDEILTFGTQPKASIVGSNLKIGEQGISFKADGQNFNLALKGIFDFYNSLAAITTARAFDVKLDAAKRALEKIQNIPGRMELIDIGQKFKILVDYAPEPESLKQLFATIKHWGHEKIIHVLGSTGGGRDITRRKILGELSGNTADFVIVTNEDPYNDDPQKIIDDVAMGAMINGKVLGQTLFKILDRRQGIAKALSLANEHDLVIITGKGAEQKMAVKNRYIPWDDRTVTKEELKKLFKL